MSAFEVLIQPSLTTTTLSNRMQVVIVMTLPAFLLIVLLPWLILDPPVSMEHIYPEHYTFISYKTYNMSVGKSLFLLTCSYIILKMLIAALFFL